MKILVFSDFHSHDYKTHNKGAKSRLDIGLDILQHIYQYANDNGVDFLCFCGDWFDSPKLLPTVVVNRNTEVMLELSKKYPNLFCLAISGNHDHSSKNLIHKPAVTALTYLQEITPKNFRIIDDSSITIGDIVITGIPYYEYADDFKQKLKQRADHLRESIDIGHVPKDAYKLLLIHQTPSGMGNPNIPVDTDVNDPVYDIWDEVMCGHIHCSMKITPKFTIVGNTHHRDLGDEGQEKGFWVIDTDTKIKEFVSLKGKYPEYRRARVSIGESVPDDGYNYYVPQYLLEGPVNNVEGAVKAEDFGVDLSAESLIQNYLKQVAPDDEELLKVGLECLKIKVEE